MAGSYSGASAATGRREDTLVQGAAATAVWCQQGRWSRAEETVGYAQARTGAGAAPNQDNEQAMDPSILESLCAAAAAGNREQAVSHLTAVLAAHPGEAQLK